MLLWNLDDLKQRSQETLDVTVSGTVTRHCGTVQYLDGGWTVTSTAADGTTTQSSPTVQIPITSTCQ